LDLALPAGLEQALLVAGALSTHNRFDAHGSDLVMDVRGRLARRHLAGERIDGVVQIGTGFTLSASTTYVTLEDMTLRQGVAIHPVFSRMSRRGVAAWERRRAAIYSRARMCTVASQWAERSLLEDYGLAREHVAVVGFGANHEPTVSGRTWWPPRFLFVGIDWERKGGPLLLRAFERLRETYPDASLDLAGGHPPVTQAGVDAHGMLAQTHRRSRDELVRLYARATCLVMPSLVEPFGIVHVEAARAGLASIVSLEGGAAEIVGAQGGIAVDPHDENALVEAMVRIADPAVAERMGRAARERSRLYTWPAVAGRLLRALGLQAPDGDVQTAYL
jgi:glycosyltransferase involved in cell wall biosynthesis